ncbi:cobalamin biosynthesis protein [Deinococcus peraridilitoris]|uniref:Cobalamin biosynthesis protein CbiG n=1 Tax=Deinococcus peraridilitoris (strain DSM 19664 / LMG 22246 / CIP 109416 / KR-200) TaxID=937777 RepID=L0A1S1_DEIPD|nr:cobalamin biosynthesis protein [Deinococcus peraridilitoris]AFZ67791.1 cobalamin biosynthesis protein CbiG [Deinococcus peraridilitoris DSM 19664]
MSVGVWLVRPAAEALGQRVAEAVGGEVVRPWLQEGRSREVFARLYPTRAQWVLIGTTGIAVRFLDGLMTDKRRDAAVVVLDEGAHFAVSLLCGHEGGANRLAYRVANAVNAVPIVTTASEAVRPLTLGVGCRLGARAEAIEACVKLALGTRDLGEVREVATVDLKAQERGLLEFCEWHGLPLRIFSRAALAARPWVTRPSAWVERHVGAVGVCEPCALLASARATLLVPKTTLNGVAVAVAQDSWEAA